MYPKRTVFFVYYFWWWVWFYIHSISFAEHKFFSCLREPCKSIFFFLRFLTGGAIAVKSIPKDPRDARGNNFNAGLIFHMTTHIHQTHKISPGSIQNHIIETIQKSNISFDHSKLYFLSKEETVISKFIQAQWQKHYHIQHIQVRSDASQISEKEELILKVFFLNESHLWNHLYVNSCFNPKQIDFLKNSELHRHWRDTKTPPKFI